ncbi:hypothetical protein KVA01_19950 [Kocuria varians]|uniref:TM2 domain-containing protein n=1 Tax=Kocuria varians TaxID=1272 RepID=A0A4Y4DAS9_KOCVA|nr:TM2 domain-containing protein [Kocuria varians]GEC99840.1 hypothetical protein KVA01_19950 [Kocuria varians]
MAEEPEYYKAQPLPPRNQQTSQGYRGATSYGSSGGWGAPAGRPVTVNVVGGKSALLAYVLWFFLGQLGIHKFYLAQPFQGILYLLLGGIGWATAGILIGWFFLIPLWILMFIDLFVIPVRVAVLNARLAYGAGGY